MSKLKIKKKIERLKIDEYIKDKVIHIPSLRNIDINDYVDSHYFRFENMMFENCTLNIDDTYPFDDIKHIRFANCVFMNCKIVKVKCNELIFENCILYNISTIQCNVDELHILLSNNYFCPFVPYTPGYFIPVFGKNNSVYSNYISIDNSTIMNMIDNYYKVDFRGISYNYLFMDNWLLTYGSLTTPEYIKNTVFSNLFNNTKTPRIIINQSKRLSKSMKEITGYKVVAIIDKSLFKKENIIHPIGYGVAELIIPKESNRVACVYSDKCRCESAKVKSIKWLTKNMPTSTTITSQNLNHNEGLLINTYNYDEATIVDEIKYAAISPMYSNDIPILQYKKNQIITSDKYDDNMFEECTNGIHFFLTVCNVIEFYNNTIA